MSTSYGEYDPELRRLAHLKPPVIRPLLPLSSLLLRGASLAVRSDERTEVVRDRGLMFIPREGRRDEVLIYFHGGGFVYPAAPYHSRIARFLSERLSMEVLLPDYPLSPKHRFPEAIRFSCSLVSSICRPVILMGESSGGNIAAVVSHLLRDSGHAMPLCQLLIYPYISIDRRLESMRRCRNTPMCSAKAAEAYERLYLGGKGASDPLYDPLLFTSFSGIEPTYIEAAEHDALSDGARLYHQQLIMAGSESELAEVRGAMHGYDFLFGRSAFPLRYAEGRVEFIRRFLS